MKRSTPKTTRKQRCDRDESILTVDFDLLRPFFRQLCYRPLVNTIQDASLLRLRRILTGSVN